MAGTTSIAALMLRSLPADEQINVVRKCLASLRYDLSLQEVSLTAALLTECNLPEAMDEFVRYLHDLLEQGRLSDVLSVVQTHNDIGNRLTESVVSILHGLASPAQDGQNATLALQHLTITSEQSSKASSTKDLSTLIDFIKHADVTTISRQDVQKLYLALLFHLGTSHPETQLAARDALVAVFSTSNQASGIDDTLVWQRIKGLLEDPANVAPLNLGYSLWLWWASSRPQSLPRWFDDSYWTLIQLGLRFGDNERRKQCLGILRQSVAVAAVDPSLRSNISPPNSNPSSTETILSQYDRYLTVFETCILGRYLNQVMACEDDLDLLISPQSIVKSRWICCLLSAALDPKVQESNRKYIGGWIIRKRYQPKNPTEFHDFFQGTLMPFLVQGHLFTNSLSKAEGSLRCKHGDRLADYLKHILSHNASNTALLSSLVSTILDNMIGRNSARFAYATVYLIHGLALGLASIDNFHFSPPQADKILELSSAVHLPEISRDYVYIRCLQLASKYAATLSTDLEAQSQQWKQLQEEATGFQDTPLAAVFANPSRRDQLETQTRQKLDSVLQACRSQSMAADKLTETLTDIREDVDYLEYPKRLLLQFTELVFEPTLVESALIHEELGRHIASNIWSLQQMSANRIYLISPLTLGLSKAILIFPQFKNLVSPQDFVLNYCKIVPEPSLDLKLEEATSVLLQTTVSPVFARFNYSYYFGHAPRVGIAALLDLLIRLGPTDQDVLHDIFDTLLSRWAAQPNAPPSVSAWKSTLQLQIMILCCERVIPRSSAAQAQKILKDLHYILAIEPLPRYRYLLSWLMARAYLQHEDLKAGILEELGTKDHHSNPKYLASLMKIAIMLARVPEASEEYASQLASACVPLAASSKVVIRHEAQWQIPLLLDHARKRNWTSVTTNAGFLALDDYIRNLARFDNPPLERVLDRFDPIIDHTLTNLSEGLWYGLDDIESSICGRNDFIQVEHELSKHVDNLPPRSISLGPEIVHPPQPTTNDTTFHSPSQELPLTPSNNSTSSRALQTKGTAYLATSNPTISSRRRDIIIVASLVDNPYNLGGISRASEIFGARELHLQNQNVTSNRDFQNVAVSSHLHFPILQLSASGVSGFCAGKRGEGYKIVGIEQTDRSVILGSKECVLPEKVVLVIGSEKEGIPALVLSECDVLVEIPQQGVTRSLNVQTAVSIVLFEYARQYGDGKS